MMCPLGPFPTYLVLLVSQGEVLIIHLHQELLHSPLQSAVGQLEVSSVPRKAREKGRGAPGEDSSGSPGASLLSLSWPPPNCRPLSSACQTQGPQQWLGDCSQTGWARWEGKGAAEGVRLMFPHCLARTGASSALGKDAAAVEGEADGCSYRPSKWPFQLQTCLPAEHCWLFFQFNLILFNWPIPKTLCV